MAKKNNQVDVLIMLCSARSGGTLLNQCLGKMPNTVILSEVNPIGSGGGALIKASSPYEQALRWYGIELKSKDFTGSIIELIEVCKQKELSLIIRDWSIVNFMPMSQNNYEPPYKFLAIESLKGKCNMTVFAFVRNAIDVFISQGSELNSFSVNYLKYIKAVQDLNIPIFKFEDLCQFPERILADICALTGVEFAQSYKNFSSFLNVNGDIQVKGGSRGWREKKIVILPRKRIGSKKVCSINQCEDIVTANKLLGYPGKYEDAHIESVFSFIFRKYQSLINRIRGQAF